LTNDDENQIFWLEQEVRCPILEKKYLWELLLELANWRYYILNIKDYLKTKNHKEIVIEEIIDKPL